MQLLLIGGTESEKVLKDLVELASKPENYWRGPGTKGENADYKKFRRDIQVRNITDETTKTYHVIFTVTCSYDATMMNGELVPMGETLVRHATIGCEHGTITPDPFAVLTICKFLGFIGGFDDWQVVPHPQGPSSIVVFQNIQNPNAKPA